MLFAASWEIDFWGKFRRDIESERASYFGIIAAYDDALVTLLADVASTYVNIRTLEERLRVARRNLELQQESLRIATAQFKGGETSERDVQQATTQLAQTESQLPHLQEALMQNKDALAVLLLALVGKKRTGEPETEYQKRVDEVEQALAARRATSESDACS